MSTTTAPASIRLAVIPGDGIGPEVVAEGLKVLRAATGTLPDAVLAEIRQHDVILLGAVGDPGVPSGVLERGLLLKLRFELDHYVNLRPAKIYPGVSSPLNDTILERWFDFVVVREGTEGPYVGNGGAVRAGTPNEIATEVSINTAFGVERVVRDAFARAAARPAQHLTLVHKHNVLTHAGHLWRRTVERVGEDFPQVRHDYLHVDAATIFMVTDPARFDVIVTDNLFGDVLSDEAAMTTGSLGMLPSASLGAPDPKTGRSRAPRGRHTAGARVQPPGPAVGAARAGRNDRSTAQIGESIAQLV